MSLQGWGDVLFVCLLLRRKAPMTDGRLGLRIVGACTWTKRFAVALMLATAYVCGAVLLVCGKAVRYSI